MATARIAYRRSAIGISAGLGIALPLAAYAATLPFEGINDVVRVDAMPFAAGIVAGVGMLTLTGHLLDRHAERVEAEEAEAAQFSSIFSDSDVVVPRTARDRADAPVRGKRFAGQAAKGVPVISRATDALSEAEAWAEIDAMFSEDSPISCDPAHSKDVYQIAFEELRRAEQSATASSAPTSADSTAMFMAMADAAAPSQTASVQVPHSASVTSSMADLDLDEPSGALSADALQEASDRDAAMQALYGSAVNAPKIPVMSAPSAPAAVQSAQANTYTTPMADYSGHEGMWASALAILEELDDAPAMVATPSETSFVSRSRMAAVAEGGNATKVHSRVNSLIEEEFDKVPSKGVHHTAHEYLKVIDGGTASLPKLKVAEA